MLWLYRNSIERQQPQNIKLQETYNEDDGPSADEVAHEAVIDDPPTCLDV